MLEQRRSLSHLINSSRLSSDDVDGGIRRSEDPAIPSGPRDFGSLSTYELVVTNLPHSLHTSVRVASTTFCGERRRLQAGSQGKLG